MPLGVKFGQAVRGGGSHIRGPRRRGQSTPSGTVTTPRELRENTTVVAASRVRDCRDFAWLGNAVAPAWRGNVCEYEGAMGRAIGVLRLDSKSERRRADRDRALVAGGAGYVEALLASGRPLVATQGSPVSLREAMVP